MTTKHTVTDSRGKVHNRTSANRVYSHAVIAHWPERKSVFMPDKTFPPVSDARWASKRHLAEQYAADCRRRGAEVEIIEVIHG